MATIEEIEKRLVELEKKVAADHVRMENTVGFILKALKLADGAGILGGSKEIDTNIKHAIDCFGLLLE
jgi:hypothetical protein